MKRRERNKVSEKHTGCPIGQPVVFFAETRSLLLLDIFADVEGDRDNDDVYHELRDRAFKNTPVLWYKQMFGESFGASSFGVYVGAECLRAGRIPQHLFFFPEEAEKFQKEPRNILVYNHFHDKDHSIILLTK